MKRFIILLAVFVTAFSVNAIPVSAATKNPTDEVFWVNATEIYLDMTFSGTTVTCSGRVKGISTVNSIAATFTLKNVSANTTPKTWSGLSSSTSTLNFSGTYSPVSKGETYRLEVTATLITTSGVRETVSDYIEKTY